MGSRRLFIRFVVVNVVNTGAYYLLYLLFLLAVPYVLANVAALAISILLAYLANARFAFRVRMTGRSLAMFVSSNLVTTVLRTLVLWLLVEFLGTSEQIAPILATGITLPVAFLLTKVAMTQQRLRPRPALAG